MAVCDRRLAADTGAVCRQRWLAEQCERPTGAWLQRLRDAFFHELLNLTQHPLELVDEFGMVPMLPKRGDKRPVIPTRTVRLTRKPFEHSQTDSSKPSQDRARVMA